MHRYQRATWVVAAVGAVLGAAACGSDPLEVPNVNNPDRTQVLALPRDVESLASKLYQNVHSATVGNTGGAGGVEQADGVYQPALTMGFENGSGLNNYGMGPRGQIPRNFIENSSGNAQSVGNLRDFRNLQNTARTATVILEKINATGFTLGNAGNDLRVRAFTWFGYGTALGNVALAYDSAAIPLPNEGAQQPPLVGHDSVMRAGLRALDSALFYANNATTSNIPAAWLAQSGDMTRADFVRLVRSYKARFRAQVARTPQERAAVDWNAVIADATNGITSDFVMQLVPGAGWDYAWLIQHYVGSNWHQMVPYIINMADTTGAYDEWLAVSRDSRKPFLIRTPDNRFPSGATRDAQIANSPTVTTITTRPYLRNRPSGDDLTNSGWNESWYDHWRWRSLFLSTRVGPWTPFSRVENDMYAAEGYIRTGNIGAAATLIDRSRTASGLPPIAGTVASASAPIPGPRCVPRVPVGPSFTTTACGSILEAMKWESRMESAYAGYATWYFNGRGWGDLPPGTATEWPVPWQELDVRQLPIYNTGGATGNSVHGPSTYGFGTGAR
jgi:hypothetical protein